MPMVVAYIILCLIAGVLGRHKTVGFWGFFILSVILTPIAGIAVLILGMDREVREVRVKG